jgi:hypothetical protein
MRGIIFSLSITLSLLFYGCSGAVPTSPDLSHPADSQPSSRVLWALYHITIEPSASGDPAIEILPLRTAEFNANVQRFLSPPVSPTSLLTIKLLPDCDIPSAYLDLDIGIKHPFPGLAQFRGFDVRGIFMADASTPGIHDPPIIYSPPAIGGSSFNSAYMLNSDGYSRWWNASEFTDPMPLLSFKPGKLGNDPIPSATLNPYKYFADELSLDSDVSSLDINNRGSFSAGYDANHRQYKIQFVPTGSPKFSFNYAVDASWLKPDESGAPDYPLDSFSPSAQTQEAYNISISDAGSDAYMVSTGESGGDIRLNIEVFDWQGRYNPNGVPGEISSIWIEGAPLTNPVDILPLTIAYPGIGATSSVFQIDLDTSLLSISSSGDFQFLGTVESKNPSTYMPQLDGGSGFIYPQSAVLSSYFIATVHVGDVAPDKLQIATPNGGEVWTIGSKQLISWTGGSGIDYVSLEYSKDNFVSDINLIVDDIANTGSYLWFPVPEDPATTVKVRVKDFDNPLIYDDSDDYFEIAVSDTPPELVATLTGFHSPFVAKVDMVKNDGWVDCTQAAPVLDFGFYRIDNSEIVTKDHEKIGAGFQGMPGYYGLNDIARKIIAPDCLGLNNPCPVDIWDLDGGPDLKFYIPLDPSTEGIMFCGDGELFGDLSVAVVTDTAVKPNGRLITWDYTDPDPEYVVHWTTEFPDLLEADYTGHRLFVYCRGDFGGPGPTIEVYNAEDWSLITSFQTNTAIWPFMSDIDYDPVLHQIYFGSGTSGQFEIWNSDTYEFIQTIQTPYTTQLAGVDHMNGKIYVTVPGHLLVYSGTTYELLWDVTVTSSPRCLACNPNTGKIYIPDMHDMVVTVYKD